MNIYIICPVRGADAWRLSAMAQYAAKKRAEGHVVHFPPDSVDQSDPIGLRICEEHRAAMERADEVHVLWHSESKGSHFDLGMAFALRKKIVAAQQITQDVDGKSYWKVICALARPAAAGTGGE